MRVNFFHRGRSGVFSVIEELHTVSLNGDNVLIILQWLSALLPGWCLIAAFRTVVREVFGFFSQDLRSYALLLIIWRGATALILCFMVVLIAITQIDLFIHETLES